MQNKSLATIFLLIGLIGPTTVVKAGSIVYSVNETFGSDSITGTITTDGTTGTIASASDITGWSLTLQDGNALDTFTLTQGNSTQYVSGSDLSATASQLSFNFSDSAGGYLFFQDPHSNVNGPYACFISNDAGCFHTDSIVFDPTAGTNSPSNPNVAMSGTQVIGTVVTSIPEPGSMGLMLAGFAAMALLVVRLRRCISSPARLSVVAPAQPYPVAIVTPTFIA